MSIEAINIRPFTSKDLKYLREMYYSVYSLNYSNNDKYVETYHLDYYLKYMNHWPELCLMAETSLGTPIGYSKKLFIYLFFHNQSFFSCHFIITLILVMGKSEGKNNDWHSHVTAIAIAPKYRRIGAARALMDRFEEISEM